ncbi:MAG TPA: enoyl-CoA hydratase/isomerase family protein [Blastocatellia bacterium]|nr:enoyl-CoA hydratase/isomerase family protein [Blastocatellia bacterium]
MQYIKTETDDGILIVTMSRGKANALDSVMVDELSACIKEAASSESVRGVVLASDRQRFFSGGFDVLEVFGFDRETMTEFFGRFIDLYEAMLSLPKPIVAAASGHAYAGGAVLALASDARVMAEGEYGLALNEINLGIVLPPGMMRMAIRAVGTRVAREMVVEGRTLTPGESLEAGLACELAAPEETLGRAIRKARALAEKPALTYGGVKRLFNEVVGLPPAASDRDALGRFIEHWFSPECVRHRQSLIDSLKERSQKPESRSQNL